MLKSKLNTKLLSPLIATVAITPFISSCSIHIDPDPQPEVPIEITFVIDETKGEHIVKGSASELVKKDTAFGLANTPIVTKEGERTFILNGWSLTEGGSIIDPTTPVTENVEVYPIWVEEKDQNSSIMAVIGDYRYYCNNTLWTDENVAIHLEPFTEGAPVVEDIPRAEFTYDIEIGNQVQYLPDYFLCNCTGFNGKVTFNRTDSMLVYIGLSFMSDCKNFEKTLVLPNNIKCIHDNFMGNCEKFNSPLTIPRQIQIIGRDFLSDCYAFNQFITFSDTIDYLGEHCMFNCDSFTSVLEIDTPMENIEVGSGASWASQTQSSDIATIGFEVWGDQAEAFIGQFPPVQGQEGEQTGYWRQIQD